LHEVFSPLDTRKRIDPYTFLDTEAGTAGDGHDDEEENPTSDESKFFIDDLVVSEATVEHEAKVTEEDSSTTQKAAPAPKYDPSDSITKGYLDKLQTLVTAYDTHDENNPPQPRNDPSCDGDFRNDNFMENAKNILKLVNSTANMELGSLLANIQMTTEVTMKSECAGCFPWALYKSVTGLQPVRKKNCKTHDPFGKKWRELKETQRKATSNKWRQNSVMNNAQKVKDQQYNSSESSSEEEEEEEGKTL
jgi:hypothetical protein